MTLSGKRLVVAIPDTVLEERDSVRDKTVKLGRIARAAAIYGTDLIGVYRDVGGRGEAGLVKEVLEYLETPQYLRRRLYPLKESLRFAGLLPPLRIPSHKGKVALDQVHVGEEREGVANPDGTADVGLDASPRLTGGAAPGSRVTVRVVSTEPFVAEPIGRAEAGDYWGYQVELVGLEELLHERRFGLRVATSRYGEDFKPRLPALTEALGKAETVTLIFGSPSRGLFDIVGKELPRRVDFVLNLFPEQHVQTVRTEEAIYAGLGLLSAIVA